MGIKKNHFFFPFVGITLKKKYIFVMSNKQKNRIMNASTIIKSAGFKTKRIEMHTFKGVFGGNCNHVIALINADGKTLHLDGKPYFPQGRKEAFASLIESGDINAPAFTWE